MAKATTECKKSDPNTVAKASATATCPCVCRTGYEANDKEVCVVKTSDTKEVTTPKATVEKPVAVAEETPATSTTPATEPTTKKKVVASTGVEDHGFVLAFIGGLMLLAGGVIGYDIGAARKAQLTSSTWI